MPARKNGCSGLDRIENMSTAMVDLPESVNWYYKEKGLQKKVTVKVQKGTVKTKKIFVESKKVSLKKGQKLTLEPTLNPITSLQKITYKFSNNEVATVTNKGVVKAKKAGKAKITVKSGSKKVVVTVTVKK